MFAIQWTTATGELHRPQPRFETRKAAEAFAEEAAAMLASHGVERYVSVIDEAKPRPYKWVCRTCGSDKLYMDATAIWNIGAQEWELCDTCQTVYCEACDGETSMEDAPATAQDLADWNAQ